MEQVSTMEGSAQAALERLMQFPRTTLGFYPTPVEPLPRLRAELGAGAPPLLIKRDDYTGFGLGGNKVRKLEYVLDPETLRECDVLITAGGFGSNHARVTAAAAARLGKRCILVLNGTPPDPPRGNALLQRLFGAEIVNVAGREERAPRMQQLAQELAAQGQRAVVVPLGASTPVGALGYVRAALELAEQLRAIDADPAKLSIVISASSCGTLAGLLLGLQLTGLHHVRPIGVSPDISATEMRATTREIAAGSARLLGFNAELPDDWPTAVDQYVGAGYGIPTDESREALELFARREGILIDPVYSAKAAACLIDWARNGLFPRDHTVLFWHTGGYPAVFA